MNNIFKYTFAVFALLASTTTYGEGAGSSKSVSVELEAFGNAGYLRASAQNDQRFPENAYISISGWNSNGEYYQCSEYGSAVANMVDATPTASSGSIRVNTSQFYCDGTPPIQIIMNCIANGKYTENFMSHISTTSNGMNSKYNGNKVYNWADCTGTVDQVEFNSSPYLMGYITHTQYVNTNK